MKIIQPTIPIELSLENYDIPGEFPLFISTETPQYPSLPHFHNDFMELVVVTSGEGMHIHGDNAYPIHTGDVFVIREGVVHSYAYTQELNLLNMMSVPSFLLPNLHYIDSLPGYHVLFTLEPQVRFTGGKKSFLHLTMQEMENAKLLFIQLEEELKFQRGGYRCLAQGLFMQLVVFLSRCYENQKTLTSQPLLVLGECMTFLNENFKSRITLEELADLVHMTPRTLSRLFKRYLHYTPIDYLRRLRVTKAAELLQNTSNPITEIAFACGFNDSNYFSRAFRSVMGISPTDYRQNPPKR